jgi:hypothetical protein
MSVRISIAYDIDGHVESYLMDVEHIVGIYDKIINNIKIVISLPNAELSLEILNEEEYLSILHNIRKFLSNPLRVIRSMRDMMELNHREIWVYIRRTDIYINQIITNNTFSIPILVTAGATNNTFGIILEVNQEDNYAYFMNKLCRILMDYIEWIPFKQYIVKNDYILQANYILLYFMPLECGIFECDLIILISDSVLPCDLDYALPRLQ